jgi:hypothetical protein
MWRQDLTSTGHESSILVRKSSPTRIFLLRARGILLACWSSAYDCADEGSVRRFLFGEECEHWTGSDEKEIAMRGSAP